MKLVLSILAALTLFSAPAQAGETHVAVAANFTATAKDIAAEFEKKTGNTAILSFGSTGKLYTQIANGAPFQIFLAADDVRPAKAEDEGLAVAGSRFTYAMGKLVLYSTDKTLVDRDGAVLARPDAFAKLAIANPNTAPYGSAAVEVMKAKAVYDAVADRLVQGDSIAQTFQFVETGNAALGFVALSQVIASKQGSRWIVPQDLYTPIRQDAVLLKTGEQNEAAKAFLDFLKGPEAKKIIQSYGYGLDSAS